MEVRSPSGRPAERTKIEQSPSAHEALPSSPYWRTRGRRRVAVTSPPLSATAQAKLVFIGTSSVAQSATSSPMHWVKDT